MLSPQEKLQRALRRHLLAQARRDRDALYPYARSKLRRLPRHGQLAALSRATGVPLSRFSEVLRGHRRAFSVDAAADIARVTDIPLEVLLGLDLDRVVCLRCGWTVLRHRYDREEALDQHTREKHPGAPRRLSRREAKGFYKPRNPDVAAVRALLDAHRKGTVTLPDESAASIAAFLGWPVDRVEAAMPK